VNEPAKSDPLYPPANEEVQHHRWPVLQTGAGRRNSPWASILILGQAHFCAIPCRDSRCETT
jgi:hypothetical protein